MPLPVPLPWGKSGTPGTAAKYPPQVMRVQGLSGKYLRPQRPPAHRVGGFIIPCEQWLGTAPAAALPGGGAQLLLLGHFLRNGEYPNFRSLTQHRQFERYANRFGKQQLLQTFRIGNGLFADIEEHIARPESRPLGR